MKASLYVRLNPETGRPIVSLLIPVFDNVKPGSPHEIFSKVGAHQTWQRYIAHPFRHGQQSQSLSSILLESCAAGCPRRFAFQLHGLDAYVPQTGRSPPKNPNTFTSSACAGSRQSNIVPPPYQIRPAAAPQPPAPGQTCSLQGYSSDPLPSPRPKLWRFVVQQPLPPLSC